MALEALASVSRLLEEVPLSPDERAAAEGDAAALESMLAKLRDTPALDSRTPREIGRGHTEATDAAGGGIANTAGR